MSFSLDTESYVPSTDEYYYEMYKAEIELWDLKENNTFSSTTAIQIER